MSVMRLRAELTSAEFERWGIYYGRQAQRREIAAKRRY